MPGQANLSRATVRVIHPRLTASKGPRQLLVLRARPPTPAADAPCRDSTHSSPTPLSVGLSIAAVAAYLDVDRPAGARGDPPATPVRRTSVIRLTGAASRAATPAPARQEGQPDRLQQPGQQHTLPRAAILSPSICSSSAAWTLRPITHQAADLEPVGHPIATLAVSAAQPHDDRNPPDPRPARSESKALPVPTAGMDRGSARS
jgi:hypothetical protein